MGMDVFNPVMLFTGRDCVKRRGDFARFGRRALVVCGQNAAYKSGALADLETVLQAQKILYAVFDQITPNPLLETVYEGGAAARALGAEMVIGLGGGSALDAAKAVALFAANPALAPMDLYGQVPNPALPIVCINTTAGTGSEVTPTAVLTVPELGNKKSITRPDLYPKLSFCDPVYTHSLPLGTTVSTAVDALSHAMESVFSPKATPMSHGQAFQAISMLASVLPGLTAHLPTAEQRETLLYASTLAGYAIACTGCGFVHAAGYPLTYHHDLPHGTANAYFLPDYLAKMALAAPELAQKVLALLHVESPEGLRAMLSRFPAMPLTLELTREQAAAYAATAGTSKNLRNGAYVVTREELTEIFCNLFCKNP